MASAAENLDSSGKVAVITGTAGGIGRALAQRLGAGWGWAGTGQLCPVRRVITLASQAAMPCRLQREQSGAFTIG